MADRERNDCPERVALELAYHISAVETRATNQNTDTREYWLQLMYDCRRVVVVGARPKD
jgi:hypothetical protein